MGAAVAAEIRKATHQRQFAPHESTARYPGDWGRLVIAREMGDRIGLP